MGCATIYPSGSVAAKPTIVHIPHSSTCIPERYRHEICLSYAELTAELLVMTDWFTDQLFGQATRYGATLFVNEVSRLVMDPERFPDDHEEPMAAKGMGAVYVSTSNGRPLGETSFSARETANRSWMNSTGLTHMPSTSSWQIICINLGSVWSLMPIHSPHELFPTKMRTWCDRISALDMTHSTSPWSYSRF